VSSLLKKEKGFTLIEIVLVLAIAGLILVIVFLALSGAQKSRRDTQRKTDVGRIASQLEQYASNNNGAYPTTAAQLGTFVTQYLTPTTDYQDPSTGANYTLNYTTVAPTTAGNVSYMNGQKCNGSAMTAGTARDYALLMYLESGGAACRTND
jgi:prepilin-type N-terminal cleavage/methylation domain-containing protein